MLRTATQKGRLLLAVGSVVAVAAGAMALRADLMVGYGFSRALEAQKPVRPFEATRGDVRRVAEVGDEVYWLSQNEFKVPVASVGRFAVGERIRIGHDGRELQLEVVALRVPLVNASVSTPGLQVEVTCRVLNPAHPDGVELVRFIVKVEEPKPAAVHEPQGSTQRPVGPT
jgi:hypothetical protein